jgi:hypothetical protein
MGKDIYHNQVKMALQKDGWLITHDPYNIRDFLKSSKDYPKAP